MSKPYDPLHVEIARWPGARLVIEEAGKHIRAVAHFAGKSRFITISRSLSDRRGALNAVADLKRELRTLGAERVA